GCSKKVITIGASDKDDQIAWFSSRGPTKDGRVKPDVLLPGVNIIAARAKDTSLGNVVDEYHTSASGTSMATPHCAGVAALLLSGNPSLTPAQVKRRLMETAIDLQFDPNTQGSGRVDAYKAFSGGAPPPPEPQPEMPMPWQFAAFLAAIVAMIIIIVILGIVI
ncbi:MAG: S8 family serine peptidase, partial [Candidatus Helarchaeota archaeon]|nr:S8 family serine peptidase [Candidatus Helarchaeota archaeon]